jgi:hypothetical protein
MIDVRMANMYNLLMAEAKMTFLLDSMTCYKMCRCAGRNTIKNKTHTHIHKKTTKKNTKNNNNILKTLY